MFQKNCPNCRQQSFSASDRAPWLCPHCGKDLSEEHAAHNPNDAFIRRLLGKPAPTRNDCGYPGRFEFEDTSRMFGWGVEGEGMCDYPQSCPWYKEGKCPLQNERRGFFMTVWKEFTAALEEAAVLGEQIARQQEAVEGEEAAALTAILEKVKPVLPHIIEKVPVYYHHPGRQFSEAEWQHIEGVILVDEWRKKYDSTTDTRGTYAGGQLVLTGEGVLLVLTRKGKWSNWQGEPTSWHAEREEVTPLEAVRRFDFADITQGLVDSLREAVKQTEEQKKRLEERAARLAQFKQLVGD